MGYNQNDTGKNEWRIVMSNKDVRVEDSLLTDDLEEFILNIDTEKIRFKKIFDDGKIIKGEEFLKLGKPKTFILGDYVLERLGIADKTLITLAESGEFALGRIGGRKIIIADTFFDFLDRYHFKKRESPDEPVAIDSRGRIKKNLTYVKKKHTYIPKLRPIRDFVEDLGIEERTFVRHCEIGTFIHYRIGSLYKMSEEDYTESLMRAALSGMRSNRGGKAKKDGPKGKAGRPSEVQEKIMKRFKELVITEDE